MGITRKRLTRIAVAAAALGSATSSTPNTIRTAPHELDPLKDNETTVKVLDITEIARLGFNDRAVTWLAEQVLIADPNVATHIIDELEDTERFKQRQKEPFALRVGDQCYVNLNQPKEFSSIKEFITDHEIHGHCHGKPIVEKLILNNLGEDFPNHLAIAIHESHADMQALARKIVETGTLNAVQEIIDFRNGHNGKYELSKLSEQDRRIWKDYTPQQYHEIMVGALGEQQDCSIAKNDHCSVDFIRAFEEKIRSGEIALPIYANTDDLETAAEIREITDNAFNEIFLEKIPDFQEEQRLYEDALAGEKGVDSTL
jgi:hypothetical protein